jgi:hypothetical protein
MIARTKLEQAFDELDELHTAGRLTRADYERLAKQAEDACPEGEARSLEMLSYYEGLTAS